MSKIKELKANPDFTVNMVDLFILLCPEGKSKYVETLLRILNSTPNLEKHAEIEKQELAKEYGMSIDELNKFNSHQILLYSSMLSNFFEKSDVKLYQKFCEYNERGLIDENDLSTYKSFDKIEKSVEIAEFKEIEKELKSQTKKIYEDEEWLVLRPLTYMSSKKYGASTKWCTAAENDSDQFFNYCRKGILIYNLNKKTGLKVACFKSLSGTEFSFWNQVDDKIDSMNSGLTFDILGHIMSEVNSCPIPNLDLLDKAEAEKQEAFLKSKKKLGLSSRGVESPFEPNSESMGESIMEKSSDMEFLQGTVDRFGRAGSESNPQNTEMADGGREVAQRLQDKLAFMRQRDESIQRQDASRIKFSPDFDSMDEESESDESESDEQMEIENNSPWVEDPKRGTLFGKLIGKKKEF